jgi:acetyl-CoA carboxylase biotin carboxyl carrier protein
VNIKDYIAGIAASLASAGIEEFELTAPGRRVRLRRDAAQQTPVTLKASALSDAEAVRELHRDLIGSPSVGAFLHSHPSHDEPLVVPGEVVHAGQIVGLLQIGPILLPVVAPKDGTIAAVLAPDGAPVGYADPLIQLSSEA